MKIEETRLVKKYKEMYVQRKKVIKYKYERNPLSTK